MDTGEMVALKVIDRQQSRKIITKNLKREIVALKRLQHQHICRLLFVDLNGKYPKKYGGSRDVVVMGMELAGGGTLGKY